KNYASFAPLTSDLNDTRMWPIKRVNASSGMRSMAITSKNQNPEATMRLFDYVYSPEGGHLVRWGPDLGVIRDDAGVVRHSDNAWELKAPDGVSSNEYRMNEVTNMSLPFMSWTQTNTMQNPEQQ